MLENAISITPFDRLNSSSFKQFDRVYIGSNFCSNLIPDIKDIIRIKNYGIKKITIQTPLLTDNDFKKVLKLVKATLKQIDRVEISANDISVLDRFKNERKIDLLLARPISHDWLRMDIDMLKRFIKRFNIKYIETDESIMIEKYFSEKMNFSFHYPFEYLSMTRVCPFERKFNRICRFSCLKENIVKLNEDENNKTIYLKNNAYFRKNKLIESNNIKRKVLMYYGQKI